MFGYKGYPNSKLQELFNEIEIVLRSMWLIRFFLLTLIPNKPICMNHDQTEELIS